MARFNSKKVTQNSTTNLANGKAYTENPKLALASLLLTSFVQDQFYRSSGQTMEEVGILIDKIDDKKFPAKVAIYARDKFNMRSITHVTAAEIAKRVKGENWTKNFYEKVVQRPDDILEILSYYISKYNKPIPNSLKKGLGLSFKQFNEYHLSKYKKNNSSLSLVDAVNLIHPPHTNAIGKLIRGELKVADTWETKLTQVGQIAKTEEKKEELKKDAWEELILQNKLGYLALIRNLRNILNLEQNDKIIPAVIEQLVSEENIKKSKLLPFRFLTALNELENYYDTLNGKKVLKALNQALDISLNNVPRMDGETLVALDTSGSMIGKPLTIGSLFAAVLAKANDADIISFSDNAKYLKINTLDSISSIVGEIKNNVYASGTNFHAIFEIANKKYDRIIILSDMQAWMDTEINMAYSYNSNCPKQSLTQYRKRYDCNPNIFSFDLQGYGTLQFPESNVYALAGFSDKVFDIMKMLEQDRNALINEIEKVQL